MVIVAPNDKVFDFWVYTAMYPQIPSIELFENHQDIIEISRQYEAIPLFAGIRLSCLSYDDISLPIYGGSYKAEFTGLKQFW